MLTDSIRHSLSQTVKGSFTFCRAPGNPFVYVEYVPYYDEYPLLEDLGMPGTLDLYFNVPKPGEFEDISGLPGIPRGLAPELDTFVRYRFSKLEPNSAIATPLDPAQWGINRFNDHRIRWTYKVTNADRKEVVRQTLERWADKPD